MRCGVCASYIYSGRDVTSRADLLQNGCHSFEDLLIEDSLNRNVIWREQRFPLVKTNRRLYDAS